MDVLLGVYTDLHANPVFVVGNEEEACLRAWEEYENIDKTRMCVWVLDAKKDIWAYIHDDHMERF